MTDEAKDPAGPARVKSRLYIAALVFLLGFGVAFVMAWFILRPAAPEATPVARTLTDGDLRGILEAAEKEDFDTLSRIGGELLVADNRIPNSKTVFQDYAVPSYPPHQVYALMTRIGGEKSYRVLLTMDENDRVVSFMAEETPVSR